MSITIIIVKNLPLIYFNLRIFVNYVSKGSLKLSKSKTKELLLLFYISYLYNGQIEF